VTLAQTEVKKRVDDITTLMDPIIEDTSVPRNIRNAIFEAKKKISSPKDLSVNLASAMYILDDVSNDINMPSHVRTGVWSVISELEKLKEDTKD
jgi:hypothetical protein